MMASAKEPKSSPELDGKNDSGPSAQQLTSVLKMPIAEAAAIVSLSPYPTANTSEVCECLHG